MEKLEDIKKIEEQYDLTFIEVFKEEELFEYSENVMTCKYLLEDYDIIGLAIYRCSKIINFDFLNNLLSLKYLDLAINEISSINLVNLKNLLRLELNDNKIENLKKLQLPYSLKKLDLRGNLILKIENLDSLKNLEELNLNDNIITSLDKVSFPNNLKILDLSDNQILEIRNLDNLEKLQFLHLVGNKVYKIEGISKLSKLQSLDLWNNQISKIEKLESLCKLKFLDISFNNIQKIENLDSLKNLENLDLSDNFIQTIENLDNLERLKKINLIQNQISDVRYLLENYVHKFYFYFNRSAYSQDMGIFIGENPLGEDLEARLEIKNADERRKSLVDYYNNIKLGAEPFREAKLMILGEGGAGKTNFSNEIMGIPFERGSSATTGIKIEHWMPNIENNNYRINIWDFGGQWIQQQVHQFFLTSECVYIVILNARHSEQPHKWLDWIKNYGSNSRTIIILNQMEENANRYLEENNLKVEYPFIESFHYISLLKASEDDEREKINIRYLMEDIKNQLISLKNINVLHPINYHMLKTDLEDNYFNENHSLPFDKFEEDLIQKHGIQGNSEILLKVLQTMGTLRYFESHGRVILSPEWLSDGVYKIMMSKYANEKFGVLEEMDILKIMKEECINEEYNYKTPDIYFLRQLMQDFELAYVDENKNYFIPTQFKTDIPNEFKIQEIKSNAKLVFEFQFDTYFPEILISKLIVFFFAKVKNEIYWKTGIYLEDSDDEVGNSSSALIQSVEKERRIKIYMFGENIRGFFKEIRSKILEYLKKTNYKYSEFIISDELVLDYKELITLHKNGIYEIPKTSFNKVISINVSKTLGIINSENELRELRKENSELRKKGKSIHNVTNININGDVRGGVQTGKKSKYMITGELYDADLIHIKSQIQTFIRELEDFKVHSASQENINEIFIELLGELSKIDAKYIDENPEEAKSFLQTIYNNGKMLNDWKNITILPYEILDKGSKIIEYLKPLSKLIIESLK